MCFLNTYTFLFIILFHDGKGHQICLDTNVVVHKPEPRLSFCKEHANFGCCTKEMERPIISEYNKIRRNRALRKEWTRCQGYVRELLCQKCSPYSAHLYDYAENAILPGLCQNYCSNFFQSCRRTIKYMFRKNKELTGSSNLRFKTSFCKYLKLEDSDYCFPKLRNGIVKMQAPVVAMTDNDDCLCLEELPEKFRFPVCSRHLEELPGVTFICELKDGITIMHNDGIKNSKMLFDMQDMMYRAYWNAEEGLLAFSFHPNFTTNGLIYISYTAGSRDNHIQRVSEFSIKTGGNVDDWKIDRRSERVLLEIRQYFKYHRGGDVS